MELILLCSHIATLLAASPTRPILIALDGRCGSGKTTLAAQLAERFPGRRTIHTDDYYLPPAQRVPGWETLPCANMDLKRLAAEVLTLPGRGVVFLSRILLPGGSLSAARLLPARAAGPRGGQLQPPPGPRRLL